MSLFSGSSSASSDPFAAFSAMQMAQAAQAQTRLGQDWLAFARRKHCAQHAPDAGHGPLGRRPQHRQWTAELGARRDKDRYRRGKNISVIDALGVTMKAIQELSGKIDRMSGNKPAERPKAKNIMRKMAA